MSLHCTVPRVLFKTGSAGIRLNVSYIRTASKEGRSIVIGVVTPRHIANDLLHNLMHNNYRGYDLWRVNPDNPSAGVSS